MRPHVREFAKRSERPYQLEAERALVRRRGSPDHGRERERVIEGESPGLDVAPHRPKHRLCLFNRCERAWRIAHQISELELKYPIAPLHDRYGGMQQGCFVSGDRTFVRVGSQRRDEALGRANRIDLVGVSFLPHEGQGFRRLRPDQIEWIAAGQQVHDPICRAVTSKDNFAGFDCGLVCSVEAPHGLVDRAGPSERHIQQKVQSGPLRNEAVTLADRDRQPREALAVLEAVEDRPEAGPPTVQASLCPYSIESLTMRHTSKSKRVALT